jgi:hypothetical protein
MNRSKWIETYPTAILFTTNPVRNDLSLKLGMRGETVEISTHTMETVRFLVKYQLLHVGTIVVS